jgi:Methyltransferase domain
MRRCFGCADNHRVNPSDRPTPRQQFLHRLAQAQAQGLWHRLVLSRPHGAEHGVLRTTVRPIVLKGQPTLCFVDSHATSDVTKNLPTAAGLARVDELVGDVFRNAHLFTTTADLQLKLGKKGRGDAGHLSEHALAPSGDGADAPAPPTTAHDRAKQRWIDQRRPFLTALGITTSEHQLVPAMARKWKQINKFVEILAHAIDRSRLKDSATIRVVDFGAGKAYLTFAVHDWLQHGKGVQPQVTGVELRADLVEQGNRIVADLGLHGMALAQGDVQAWPHEPMDVMIALHACDTATDHAIHLGIRAGAELIVCSPCCHKQLRPQLLSPHPLRSVFQHGIHVEQQAEMLTDSLRALLLQAAGYDAQVFEFVSLEHTAKNKMILAVKRQQPLSESARAAVLAQIDELKRFFGVREQALEALLGV